MLKPRIATPTHEEAFLHRYQRLRSWALQLVQNDQQLAEDLLHDVFLQFVVSKPDLNAIENLDGYLRTMLRNMHLSQLRRASRLPEAARPLLDYDSASAGLETLKHQTEVQASDELRRICEYALLRKSTSKAASVLILRFFHAYYPVEIAQILRKSRGVVDVALRTARAEAKTYLSDPKSLAFISENPTAGPPTAGTTETSEDLLMDLRNLIFHSPSAECPPPDDLQSFFKNEEGVDCRTLAHIVSCEVCLDTVNELLGLPLLSARQLDKTIRKDTRSHKKSGGDPPKGSSPGGGSAGSGSMDRFVSRHRKRLKEMLEHHPHELRISVNGFIVGAHSVNSELSKQTLTVNLEERISFVEVFSEREVRLLFRGIEPPPDGPGAHREQVRLSEGRTIELNLDFADSRPQVYVTYHDPSYRAVPVPQADSTITDSPSASIPGKSRSRDSKGPREKLTSLLKLLRASLLNVRFWLRPATVTGLFALFLIGALAVLYWRVPNSPLTVAGLLQKAAATEASDAARVGQILHRTISLEEKRVTGELLKRQKVEVWQNAEKGVTARRLYDDRGSLVAGDWRRADGVQTLYHHGSQPKLQFNKALTAIDFENVWQLSPSAKEFSSLIGDTEGARLEETPNGYSISYERKRDEQGLVKATLLLSRSDLHAVEETLLVQQGNELRQYHFVETSFERHAPLTIAPTVFDPDPQLLGKDTETGRHGDAENIPLSPRLPVPASPVVATPELEVEVLRLLNLVAADVGEQISVSHTPQGSLRVEGVVESEKRKREILTALSSVKSNPAVAVQVQTVDEALAQQTKNQPKNQPSSIPAEIASSTASANTIPVDDELRRYFAKQGFAGAQIDEEERLFSSRMLGQSLRSMQHAWAIKRLTSRFSADQLRTLDPDARANWLEMIRGHARAIKQELAMLRQGLSPIFPMPDFSQSQMQIDAGDNKAFSIAAERLLDLCSANDTVLRSALTISSDTSRASSIKTSQFWRSLNDAQSLATVLANSK